MEPTPPEPGAGTGAGPGLIVEGREELLYLLGEAAELEHAACCSYLYAAFTLRADPGDGLTAAQVPVVAGWKRTINEIALQEMLHLALVNNLLAALGGAPRLGRHNLPQRSPYAPEIRLTLAPFSDQTLRRFLHIERPEGMDISRMAGELDHDRPAPPVPTGSWPWVPAIALALIFTPLLFPTGRLLSSRWRPIARLAGAATAASMVLGALGPELDLARDHAIVNPIGVAWAETAAAARLRRRFAPLGCCKPGEPAQRSCRSANANGRPSPIQGVVSSSETATT